MNMVAEQGAAISYYSTTLNWYQLNGYGYEYAKTFKDALTGLSSTNVWARMDHSPFTQDFVVWNPDLTQGTFYLIVKNEDPYLTSRLNVAVYSY